MSAVSCAKLGGGSAPCGFSRYLLGPDNRLQYDIAGRLGNEGWGYIVGTYGKAAGRLFSNLLIPTTAIS